MNTYLFLQITLKSVVLIIPISFIDGETEVLKWYSSGSNVTLVKLNSKLQPSVECTLTHNPSSHVQDSSGNFTPLPS